jgi:hypothetical protein
MLWISTSAYSSFRVQDVRKTCACAAMGGKLEVLQWAHRNGCPWDEHTCYWAETGGHLDVLRWTHEKGCPWSEETRAMAARLGYVGA